MKGITATVSSKGRVVIPAPLRHRLKILTGTKIHISEQQGRLILQPITKDPSLDESSGLRPTDSAFLASPKSSSRQSQK